MVMVWFCCCCPRCSAPQRACLRLANCRGTQNLDAKQGLDGGIKEETTPQDKTYVVAVVWTDNKKLLGGPSKGTNCGVVVVFVGGSPEFWAGRKTKPSDLWPTTMPAAVQVTPRVLSRGAGHFNLSSMSTGRLQPHEQLASASQTGHFWCHAQYASFNAMVCAKRMRSSSLWSPLTSGRSKPTSLWPSLHSVQAHSPGISWPWRARPGSPWLGAHLNPPVIHHQAS